MELDRPANWILLFVIHGLLLQLPHGISTPQGRSSVSRIIRKALWSITMFTIDIRSFCDLGNKSWKVVLVILS